MERRSGESWVDKVTIDFHRHSRWISLQQLSSFSWVSASKRRAQWKRFAGPRRTLLLNLTLFSGPAGNFMAAALAEEARDRRWQKRQDRRWQRHDRRWLLVSPYDLLSSPPTKLHDISFQNRLWRDQFSEFSSPVWAVSPFSNPEVNIVLCTSIGYSFRHPLAEQRRWRPRVRAKRLRNRLLFCSPLSYFKKIKNWCASTLGK